MYLKEVILVSTFAAFALGDPIPQDVSTTDLGSFPTDAGSSPSYLASISDSLASVSSLLALESGIPTLPASIESAILSAVPTSIDTSALCQTKLPDYYSSLPADIKSAILSYDSAVLSWYSAHGAELSSFLGTITSESLPAGLTTSGPQPTLPGNVCAGATGTTAHPTSTAAGGGPSGSGAAASGTPSSSSSKAAAPQATGAIGVSFVGIVGALGIMAAL